MVLNQMNPAELSSCSTSVRTKGTSSTQSLRKIIRTCMKVLEITYVYVKIIIVNWYKRTEKIINAIKNLTAEKKKENIKCD